MAYAFSRTEPYGMLILVALLVTGVFGRFMGPLLDISMKSIYAIIGLS